MGDCGAGDDGSRELVDDLRAEKRPSLPDSCAGAWLLLAALTSTETPSELRRLPELRAAEAPEASPSEPR